MANYTSNYNLAKPLPTDLYNINVHNTNMDKIDKGIADVDTNLQNHTHSLESNKVTGVLPIEKGGTGTNDAEKARSNLGAAPVSHNHSLGSGNISGVLPVTKGGTGADTVAKARKTLGLGETSGAVPVANGGTGADNAAKARENLGITVENIGAVDASEYHGAVKKTGTVCAANGYAGTEIHVTTEFEPKQTGSGNPSPNNIRPITGYDKLGLARVGKNLAPIYANETKGGMTLTAYDDGSVSLTGTYTAASSFSFRGDYDTPLPPGTYTFSVNNPEAIDIAGFWIAPYDDTETIIASIRMPEANTVHTLTTNVPIKQIRIRGARDVALNNFIIKLQVEKGSTATEFVKPHGNTYTVQIGQTVYGGKFNWLTGKLVAEYGFITLTGNEAYTSNGNDILLNLPDAPVPVPGGVEAWCSHYKRTTSATASGIVNFEFAVSHKSISGVPQLYIRDSVNCSDVSTAKAYFAGQHILDTPVQIAYKLATPIEIQLEEIGAIEALDGLNTVYCDAGECTVEFGHAPETSITYSETEQFTGNYWTDGKPIYRNVIGINVTNTSTHVNAITFNDDINMIDLRGYVVRNGSGAWRFPANWYGGTDNFHAIWMENATEMFARTTTPITGYVIIEYTKTSD